MAAIFDDDQLLQPASRSRSAGWFAVRGLVRYLPQSQIGGLTAHAALILLPLALIATLVFLALHQTQVAASRLVTRAGQEKIVELATNLISARLNATVEDILFLAGERVLDQWLATGDPQSRQILAEQYLAFAKHKSQYDQIRLLDPNGMEVVRVDRRHGVPTIVPEHELQDKSSRYYLREMQKLAPGEIYLSPLDLNVENDVVETPRKPMIRFGTALFDADGRRGGFVILNYLGQVVLDRIRAFNIEDVGTVWLLNAEGYWLLGPRSDVEWTFMYPGRQDESFASAYPAAWTLIGSEPAGGQSEADGDLFTYVSLSPSTRLAVQSEAVQTAHGQDTWFVLAHLPRSRYSAVTNARAAGFMIGWAAVLLLLAALSGAIAYHGSHRRRAEAMVRRLNDRLAQDNRGLQALNHELEAFSYSVSHDLRAPLRAIDGFSQALIEDYAARLDDGGRDHLSRVRKAAQRMGELIDDLLKLSRLSRTELRASDVDLSALAERIAEDLRGRDPSRSVEFHIAENIHAYGDPRLLQIVLENLLGNAWKFTSKNPHAVIEVGETRRNGESIYFVRDNGVGFDIAYADKLFGAFQRLHPSAEFTGSGIGLATVQRIINRHGGRIRAEAEKEKGAAFHFTLATGKSR